MVHWTSKFQPSGSLLTPHMFPPTATVHPGDGFPTIQHTHGISGPNGIRKDTQDVSLAGSDNVIIVEKKKVDKSQWNELMSFFFNLPQLYSDGITW